MKLRVIAPTIAIALLSAAAAGQSTDPRIAAWVFNIDGRHGTSPNATVDARVSIILADTQRVRYDASYVYINATSVPSYSVGPFSNNPNLPSNQNSVNRISRNPTVAVTKTATGLGTIGVLINGVGIYNARDAFSYQNANVWQQNANYFEAISFDSALGHPGPNGGYHHHIKPASLLIQLGDRPDVHSPLIGYAFDGFPIYGPYAYTNTNGTGAIKRMVSSFRLRSITTRTNGPAIGPSIINANGGINTMGPQPLGAYLQDYEYAAGSGDLDQYNGRTCITPEFPNGTYCYFATINADGSPAYPYLIGPQYNGTFVAQAGTTVPATASSQAFSSSFPCTTIWAQPSGVAATCATTAATFEVKVRYGALATYQWRKNGTHITNGGHFAGATSAILSITSLSGADAGSYDCVVSNTGACGSITTNAALLTVESCTPCAADFNQDGGIDGQDTEAFFYSWEAGDSAADVNADGGVDGSDVSTFFQLWEAGGC